MGYVDYDLVVTLLTRRSVLLHYGLVSGQQLIGLQNSGNYRAVQCTVHTQSRSHLRSVICDWLQQLAVTDGLILRSSKSVGLLCSFKFTPAKPLAHLQQNKIRGMRLGRIMLIAAVNQLLYNAIDDFVVQCCGRRPIHHVPAKRDVIGCNNFVS